VSDTQPSPGRRYGSARREGGVNTGTRYYTFAGTVCASRTGNSAITSLTWPYPDHQGTQQTAINAGTQAVTIRRQTPYGDGRGAKPVRVNSKSFVGGFRLRRRLGSLLPSGLVIQCRGHHGTLLGGHNA
jgi:hypothetical protein